MAHISRCWCIKPTCIKQTSRNVHPARFSEEVATSQFALTPAGFKRKFKRMLAPIVEGTTCWNLIAASIYDEYSVGPSIQQICTRRFFTMLNMIQACSNVYWTPVFIIYTCPDGIWRGRALAGFKSRFEELELTFEILLCRLCTLLTPNWIRCRASQTKPNQTTRWTAIFSFFTILGCYVTKFAPHKASMLIAFGQVDFQMKGTLNQIEPQTKRNQTQGFGSCGFRAKRPNKFQRN